MLAFNALRARKMGNSGAPDWLQSSLQSVFFTERKPAKQKRRDR